MGGGAFPYGRAVRKQEFSSGQCNSHFVNPRLGKPEVLTGMTLLTKDLWSFFVPFNETTRVPDGTPCRKSIFWVLD